MVGRQNNAEPEIFILIDGSPRWDKSNTATFLAIPDCYGWEQYTDGHNTLWTNLNVSELLLSQV